MFRVVLMISVLAAMAAARRSPNADLVEDFLKSYKGPRFSDNIMEDAMLDVPDLISKYRYPVEVHHVLTSDGYVLEAHRIPHGRDRNNVPIRGKTVVFLMHGLLSSSADFLVLGPGSALGYYLADEGYDVWIGNARGNYYSRRHVELDPNDRTAQDFWRFSWEQIGMYDLSAYVDYILAMTGQSKMHYIGHSQGGTSFLVLNSMKPEYNDKFISFQGLAASAYFFNNENTMFTLLAPFERIIEATAFALGFAEIFPKSTFLQWTDENFCENVNGFNPLCSNAVFRNGINETMLPIINAHAPAGASIRQVSHYSQSIRRNTFGRFDFGAITNLIVYGSITPPDFDMSLVTAPSYLHYGLSDIEVNYRDVHVLAEKLGNTVGTFRQERESFDHYDFIWGSNVKAELYEKLLELMRTAE